jgi:phosphatidyl-myo-inositol dimannoside synthase
MSSHHLLVTNDFPPKVGGIQNYLWELWKRLDPASFTVLTASSDPHAEAFDQELHAAGFRIERVPEKILFFPTPKVTSQIKRVANSVGADFVLLDPALPLGLAGPRLGLPYGVILHGAEVTVPGRVPLARQTLARVLRKASLIVSAGGYPAAEGLRASGGNMAPVVNVPPGVDCAQLAPESEGERQATRERLGLPPQGPLVVSVSRLVPRKGMDVLIDAAARLVPSFPDLTVAIAGAGREAERLAQRVAAAGAPVHLLGRVDESEKQSLLAAADVFVMACRNRWAGLEQEGFGIVFLEAAAVGVPQIAGESGGAAEAVIDGETGLVVKHPEDPAAVALALRELLIDPKRRSTMGMAARQRALASFDYALLAPRLAEAIAKVPG